MSKIVVPNRLGWVTELNIHHLPGYADVTSFSDSARQYIKTSDMVDLDLRIRANNVPALIDVVKGWYFSGIESPTFQREFFCLYCASPNSIEHTHCKKCGAPRSFVIG